MSSIIWKSGISDICYRACDRANVFTSLHITKKQVAQHTKMTSTILDSWVPKCTPVTEESDEFVNDASR